MNSKWKTIGVLAILLAVWAGLTMKDRSAGHIVLAERFDPNLPTLMELGASWCPPCRAMKPILKDLQDNFAGFNVKYVDVEKDVAMARQYNVSSIPVIVFMDAGGKTLYSQVGGMSEGAILARWKELGVITGSTAAGTGTSKGPIE